MCYNASMVNLPATEKQQDPVRHILKSTLKIVVALPWAIVLFYAVFLGCLAALFGSSGTEFAKNFVLDAYDPILLLQFKMLVVVCAIHALWLLTSRDQIEILLCYASDRILSHTSESLLLWASLWARLRVSVNPFASTPIQWRIQLARVVTPETRHVAGLSPQLE